MPPVGRRSRELTEEEFPEITWEHSHVVVDDEGLVRDVLRLRGAERGDRPRTLDAGSADTRSPSSYEIAGDVTPADFPPRLARLAAQPEHAHVVQVEERLLRDREPPAQEAHALDVVRRASCSSASLYSVTAYCFAQPRSASSAAATKCLNGMLELAGAAPMAGECCPGLADLGRGRLDELRDVAVPLASAGAWLKVVRDVPDEYVLERPLLVSLDPGHRVPADQVASLERGKGRAEAVAGLARCARAHRARRAGRRSRRRG